MEVFFPEKMDAKTAEYYGEIQQRTILVLQEIRGIDNRKQVEKIDNYLLSLFEPKNYAELEIKHITGFEDTCILLNQYIPKDPRTMTQFEFLRSLKTVKEQLKAQEKAAKKR